MPGLEILYDTSTDITDHVMGARSWVECKMAAQPGEFEIWIKDVARDQSFITGKRLKVILDDVPLYGGFIMHISRLLAFPVVDTTDAEAVTTRWWILRGVDYNTLFDRLKIRWTVDFKHAIPDFAVGQYDDVLVETLLATYIDKPSWLLTNIERVGQVNPDLVGGWATQGSPWREQMEDFSKRLGEIWYIDAAETLQWKAVESGGMAWGFSDVPDEGESLVGFRELDADEDMTQMVNDALVWGGDEFTGASDSASGGGKTLFSRFEDTDSIDDHGRWQWAETHFGDTLFASQGLVDNRAERIVDGPPGASVAFPTSGLKNPQWNIGLVWWDKDVPDQDHVRPGSFVRIKLNVFDVDIELPARSIRMTFPDQRLIDGVPQPIVRFEGSFGLELSDPMTLWTAISNSRKAERSARRKEVRTATDDSEQTAYGSFGQFIPTPAADGVQQVFTIKFGYVVGSTAVYVDGLRQSRGATTGENDYVETDPVLGLIRFNDDRIPDDGAKIYVECVTLDGAE